jgi:hypothetical protein
MRLFNFLIPFIAVFIISGMAYAQTPPAEGLEWLTSVINFLLGVPYVGPVLVFVIKWASIISGIATALSAALVTILKLPEVVAIFSGSQKWLERIQWVKEKILPWIQYFSMFNVQKKKK